MVAVRSILENDLIEKFGITEVIKNFEGSQKKVFIIKIGDKVQILKVFKKYSKRDIRELEIYDTYKHNKYLPKIICIEEYKGDTIVFEELIDGKTLKECKSDYIGNNTLIITLIKDIINVLDELWNNEIVHRDIKPENIIISGGKPYVIDFGVAKDLNITSITETGFQPGSKAYMSPEQILGKNKSILYRSDFFSLGVLAYHLYYGKYPFGTNLEKIIEMFTSGEVTYTSNKDCRLNSFFEGVFTTEPYSRPRNIELLLKLLP